MEPYILRADGQLHGSDIRAVSVTGDGRVLTASRDNTAQLSELPAAGDEVARGISFVGHQGFVNWALYHPSLALVEEGMPCVVTGSNDQHVAVWNVQTAELEAVLDGHAQGVCTGAILSNVPSTPSAEGDAVDEDWQGDMVTGDWGGLCCVFDHRSGRVKQRYTQHTTAIRGVVQLPHTPYCVSASGDKTAHVWEVKSGTTVQVCVGHEDVVQCVCAIDPTSFATGSNDCTVRIWHLAAAAASAENMSEHAGKAAHKEVMQRASHVLHGHDSLVYGLAWNATHEELVSASEDHTVIVWGVDPNAAKEAWLRLQTIHHPCVVWCVTAYNCNSGSGVPQLGYEGDLITGGSDGLLRVWTRNADCMASVDKLELLEAAVASQEVDLKVATAQTLSGPAGAVAGSKGHAGLDVSTMPSVAEMHRSRRGGVAGEKCFARNEADEVEVYSWGGGRWEKIGVVVSGPSHQPYTGAASAGEAATRERQLYQGKEYDYVFDVDVQGTMLRLPYNRGDNIFAAAQRFIDDHPGVVFQDSKEEIQNFIMAHIDRADLELATRAPGGSASAVAFDAISPTAGEAGHRCHDNDDEGEGTTAEAWREALLFRPFNAAGAQRVVDNCRLEASQGTFADMMHRVATVAAAATTTTTCSAEEYRAVCEALGRLLHALPPAQTWVGLDALRCLLAHLAEAESARHSVDMMQCVLSLIQHDYLDRVHKEAHEEENEKSSDNNSSSKDNRRAEAGALAELRLAGNVVAVLCSKLCTAASSDTALSAASVDALVRWAAALAQRQLTGRRAGHVAPASHSVRQAGVVVLRNLSVWLVRCGGTGSHTTALPETAQHVRSVMLTTIAQCLLAEPSGSALVPSLLTTLLTLYTPYTAAAAAAGDDVQRAQMIEQGKALLYFTLQAIATGADERCHEAANKLLQILSSP